MRNQLAEIGPFENVKINSVAEQVLVDADMSYAAEAEVEQQVPEPMTGTGMEPHGAQAMDPGVASAWHWGCPKVT